MSRKGVDRTGNGYAADLASVLGNMDARNRSSHSSTRPAAMSSRSPPRFGTAAIEPSISSVSAGSGQPAQYVPSNRPRQSSANPVRPGPSAPNQNGASRKDNRSKQRKSKYVHKQRTEFDLYENNVQAGPLFNDLYGPERDGDIRIVESDCDAPHSGIIESFEEMGFNSTLLANLRRRGIVRPIQIQKSVMPAIKLNKRTDIMAHSETGSGKTAAYFAPIIDEVIAWKRTNSQRENHKSPFCISLHPTRELALQAERDALSFAQGTGVEIMSVIGGTHVHRNLNELQQRSCDIICCTARRLLHFVKQKKILLRNVRYLVLDEADRFLQTEDFDLVADLIRSLPPNHRRLLFSATYERDNVRVLQGILFKGRKFHFHSVGEPNHVPDSIELEVERVYKEDKQERLLQILQDMAVAELQGGKVFYRTPKVIVFVGRRDRCHAVGQFLVENRFRAAALNAKYDQAQRVKAKDDLTAKRVDILVATDVASRGIDIPDVALVVNYDLPDDPEWYAEYVNKVGRTGRAGNRGRAISFFDPELDEEIAEYLIKHLRSKQAIVPDFLTHAANNFTAGAQ